MAKKAAKSRKGAKPGTKPVEQPEQRQSPVSMAREITPANKIKSLLSASSSANKQTQEINGTLGQKIANAVENDHLDRKAFNMLRAFNKMEPEKAALTWEMLVIYLDVSGVKKRMDDVVTMNFGPGGEDDGEGEEGDDEGEEEEQPQASNLRPFPTPSRVAAE